MCFDTETETPTATEGLDTAYDNSDTAFTPTPARTFASFTVKSKNDYASLEAALTKKFGYGVDLNHMHDGKADAKDREGWHTYITDGEVTYGLAKITPVSKGSRVKKFTFKLVKA